MHERIKHLRKVLNMTQDAFANKLGLARNSIASYESGRREPNDAVIRLICKTYNVDYFWLIEGTGEMFTSIPESIIDEVVEQFNLDENDRAIISAYLKMNEKGRKEVKKYLFSIIDELEKDE